MSDPGDLRPLAEKILRDKDAPPMLVLAAWQYLYGWTKTAFTSMTNAAGKP